MGRYFTPRIVGRINWKELDYLNQGESTIKELVSTIEEAIGDKARIKDHVSEIACVDYDHKRATGVLTVKIEFPITINEEQND
jgi:hypothetical protein